jgi:hypothetical protein
MADPKGIANMFLQAYGQAFQSESQQTHTATKTRGLNGGGPKATLSHAPRGRGADSGALPCCGAAK